MSTETNAGPVLVGLEQVRRPPILARDRRRPRCELWGYGLAAKLQRELPQYAVRYLRDALFRGDVEAAGGLAVAAPNEFRGMVVLAAYYLGTPTPAYREILDLVWSHDSGRLLNDTGGDLALVRRMFRAGKFQVPLSGRVRIYRGAAGVDLRTASQGISWTTSRDVACWFAMRSAFGDRPPIVVTADVDASSLSYFCDERSESEVVLRHRIRAEVDADPASWFTACARREFKSEEVDARAAKGLATWLGLRQYAQ